MGNLIAGNHGNAIGIAGNLATGNSIVANHIGRRQHGHQGPCQTGVSASSSPAAHRGPSSAGSSFALGNVLLGRRRHPSDGGWPNLRFAQLHLAPNRPAPSPCQTPTPLRTMRASTSQEPTTALVSGNIISRVFAGVGILLPGNTRPEIRSRPTWSARTSRGTKALGNQIGIFVARTATPSAPPPRTRPTRATGLAGGGNLISGNQLAGLQIADTLGRRREDRQLIGTDITGNPTPSRTGRPASDHEPRQHHSRQPYLLQHRQRRADFRNAFGGANATGNTLQTNTSATDVTGTTGPAEPQRHVAVYTANNLIGTINDGLDHPRRTHVRRRRRRQPHLRQHDVGPSLLIGAGAHGQQACRANLIGTRYHRHARPRPRGQREPAS